MGSIEQIEGDIASPIPIVDFSKWSERGATHSDRLVISQKLVEACRKVGFVYITNHGIPQDVLDEAFKTVKGLFDLSLEEKMQAEHPPGMGVHRGYSYPGYERVSQDKTAPDAKSVNWRESFEVGSEDNKQQPNIWLPEPTLPGFRELTTNLYWECNRVAHAILSALALGIGLKDTEHLTKYHSGHNNQLRLLHYPSIPASEIESFKKARMPAHNDFSSITLLFQDDCGGLEVEDPHAPGKFVPATPMRGACVVNVGDLLMRWSNDYVKSTKHRVTLPPLADRFEGEERMTRDRYSIPYFVVADPEVLVECLPACTNAQNPPKYEPITQKEYAMMRIARILSKD